MEHKVYTMREAIQAMLYNSGMGYEEVAIKGGFKSAGQVRDLVNRENRVITNSEFSKFLKAFDYSWMAIPQNSEFPALEIYEQNMNNG